MEDDCEKVGFLVKISDWTGLHWVNHYHQQANRQPSPITIPVYFERVELMTGGRGWIFHQGDWREVLPGDLIWNRPGDQTISRSDFENPYRCLAVTLGARRRRGSGMPRLTRWPDLDAVQAFALEVSRLFLDEEMDRGALFEYVASQLLLRATLHARHEGKEELPAPLRAVLRHMEENFAATCPIEELAAVSGWSVAHLHELFRKHLKTTPHQMIMRLRMRAIRERLASTNQPIKQVAGECGFADSAALANFFKAETGETPGAYRIRCRRSLV